MMKNILLLSFIFLSASLLSAQELSLKNPGVSAPIPYEKYGEFVGIGSSQYQYKIKDRAGLAEAIGSGVFPNWKIKEEPQFQELEKAGKLHGSQWHFVSRKTPVLNFYKWASCQDDPGVKLFYQALNLEYMGKYAEAIKVYYAAVVHFPKSKSYTYWDSPWYIGPTSIDKIMVLTREHPELGLKLEGAYVKVLNGYDLDTANDKFIVDPGKLLRVKPSKVVEKERRLQDSEIVKTLGKGKVQLVQFKNEDWQLRVDGKPFLVKAMAYSPNKTGLSPDRGTLNNSLDWQTQDFNKNGLIDGAYESFIDKNYNNEQDADEPRVGDLALLKDLGCNTIRAYHNIANKDLFRDALKRYGIYTIVGNVLGGYAIDSGARWEDGTDYEDPVQRKKILESVRKTVLENKDEPYVLMWMLGNENVYGAGSNANKKPEAFFNLINEAALLIKQLDPDRLVGFSNGDLKFLDIVAQRAPAVDIFGANVYRGETGFGQSLFQNVKDFTGKPVLITEFGCSAYGEGFTREEAEAYQSRYKADNWKDILAHRAGRGVGNAIGGVLFEFTDEWWKGNSDLPEKIKKQNAQWYAERAEIYKNLEPHNHDIVPQFGAPFIDGWSYEEWYGLFGQGDGALSPFIRQKRPAYDAIKALWTQPDY